MDGVNPLSWDLRAKIGFLVFLGLIVAIPSLTFLVKQRISFSSQAKKPPSYTGPVTDASSSAKKSSLLDDIKDAFGENEDDSSPLEVTPPSFGLDSTLDLKIKIEGRSEGNFATKLVIMLASGNVIASPKYLLTLAKDVPASGSLSGVSISGLTLGTQYSAYLKAPAQIAQGSTFTLASGANSLNGGSPLTLISGDFNEDNIINSADYSIIKNGIGKTPESPDWNATLDLNLDNIVNNLDLSIVKKNLDKVGDGGVYVSKVATSSGTLSPSTQGGGYWLWIPPIGD